MAVGAIHFSLLAVREDGTDERIVGKFSILDGAEDLVDFQKDSRHLVPRAISKHDDVIAEEPPGFNEILFVSISTLSEFVLLELLIVDDQGDSVALGFHGVEPTRGRGSAVAIIRRDFSNLVVFVVQLELGFVLPTVYSRPEL